MTITKSSTSFPNKGVETLFLSLGSNHESVVLEGDEAGGEFYALSLELNGRLLDTEELMQLGRSYGFTVAQKIKAYQVDEVPFDSLTVEQQQEALSGPPAIIEMVDEKPLGEVTIDPSNLLKTLEEFADDAQGVVKSSKKKR